MGSGATEQRVKLTLFGPVCLFDTCHPRAKSDHAQAVRLATRCSADASVNPALPLEAALLIRSFGSGVDHERDGVHCPTPLQQSLPQAHSAGPRRKRLQTQHPARRLSCLQRGRLVLLATLLKAEALPLGKIVPEPWPEVVTPPMRPPDPTRQLPPPDRCRVG